MPQGLIFRFKFLMLVTLACAAMTVIFFIISQVSEGSCLLWFHGEILCRLCWLLYTYFIVICWFFFLHFYCNFEKLSSDTVSCSRALKTFNVSFLLSASRWVTAPGTGESTPCRWTVRSSPASTECGTCTSLPSCSFMHRLTNAMEMNTQVHSASLVSKYIFWLSNSI